MKTEFGLPVKLKMGGEVILLLMLTACGSSTSPQPTTALQHTATASPTPQPALSPSPLPKASPTPRPNCTESALFVADVTIADNTRLQPGQSFTKTWQLRNSGTCAWNAEYALVFSDGDRMNSPDSVQLAEIKPGETLNLSVALTAPTADGFYTGLYELHNPQGQAIPIGLTKSMWVKVAVGNVILLQATAPAVAGATSVASTDPGGAAATARPKGPCKPEQNGAYTAQILALIDSARVTAGLPTLSANAKLTAAAQGHSDDMACHNFLSHTGSDGSSIYDRIAAAGYSSSYWEEIIFASGNPQQAFDWWMKDPPHRDAILNPKTSNFGAGYTYVAGSQYGGYFTVDFGRP